MTDNAIIKALECCSSDEAMICEECPLNKECYNDELPLAELALDIINRQQEQLEAAIAGQETLQKALAEETKKREVQAERLREERGQKYEQIDLLCRLRNEIAEKDKKIEQLTAEKNSLIKTFGECQAEATKALVDKDKEIERLKNNISAMAVTMRNCAKATRAEAIRAFAERLKQRCSANSDINYYILKKLVDNLVKEMVGDAE